MKRANFLKTLLTAPLAFLTAFRRQLPAITPAVRIWSYDDSFADVIANVRVGDYFRTPGGSVRRITRVWVTSYLTPQKRTGYQHTVALVQVDKKDGLFEASWLERSDKPLYTYFKGGKYPELLATRSIWTNYK